MAIRVLSGGTNQHAIRAGHPNPMRAYFTDHGSRIVVLPDSGERRTFKKLADRHFLRAIKHDDPEGKGEVGFLTIEAAHNATKDYSKIGSHHD